MRTKHVVELPAPILTVRGEFGDGLAELVTRKLAVITRHAHEPVLAIRVDLCRHHEPDVVTQVATKANVDFNGRQLHAAATGRTARDAVDRMVDRLVRQMDDRPHARRSRRGNHDRVAGRSAMRARDIMSRPVDLPARVGRAD
jgi:ribosome-associated translation inhibitor RaiA